jgi:hypothetical protein
MKTLSTKNKENKSSLNLEHLLEMLRPANVFMLKAHCDSALDDCSTKLDSSKECDDLCEQFYI